MSLLFSSGSQKHKKDIPEIRDFHACHMSWLKTARTRIFFFYPHHHSRQPEPPPTQRSWGFQIWKQFSIFLYFFSSTLALDLSFSTCKLAEMCNRCVDYLFGQTLYTSPYYKAKWRFLFIRNQHCGNMWRWKTGNVIWSHWLWFI